MLADFNIEEENLLCCILSDLFHAHMNAAPVWEATVDFMAKNMVSTVLFRDKLDCCVVWTLG